MADDPTPYDIGWFTDADEASQALRDRRAADTRMKSTWEDAQGVVGAFAAETTAGAWSPTLSRADVAARLLAIATPPANPTGPALSGPRIVDQAALNLCGPAAFWQTATGRDPVAAMRAATALFDTGAATIGALSISPSQALLGADYGAMLAQALGNPFKAADWMILSALRNVDQPFWQPSWTGDPTQELAGMTRPEELAGWMRASGIWSSVDNHGNWATNAGIPDATAIRLDDGTDVVLLIHSNLIASSDWRNPDNPDQPASADPGNPHPTKVDNTFILSSFPNHYVVLLSEPMTDVKQENVLMAIWTWGQRLYLRTPVQVFADNYYGAIIAKL